jgi:hypothetical protein
MQAPCHQFQRNFNNLSIRSKLASFVHRQFGKIKPIFLSCNNNNLANREAEMDYSNCDYDYFSFGTDDDLTYIDYTIASTYDEDIDNE